MLADCDLWARRRGVDQSEKVQWTNTASGPSTRRAAVRGDAAGGESRGLEPDGIGQRRPGNKENPSMQRNQSTIADTSVNLTIAETGRHELSTRNNT